MYSDCAIGFFKAAASGKHLQSVAACIEDCVTARGGTPHIDSQRRNGMDASHLEGEERSELGKEVDPPGRRHQSA